jgi:prolyl 4-hydroxylase
VECQEGQEGGEEGEKKGVVFTVRPGNAVYWENFRADGTGRGHEETWHAGLPVRKGVKVGLNIWSWGRIE